MARRYSLFDVADIPHLDVGEPLLSVWQQPLLAEIDAPPRTIFTFRRRMLNMPVEVYHTLHEDLVEKEGRANGKDFTAFILRWPFPSFYERRRGLMMLRTKKPVAKRAIRMLAKVQDVKVRGKEIDLKSINHLIERYKAAHFSVSNSADVTSQAIYGPSIDLDFRFGRAMGEGEIKNIRLITTYEGKPYHIGISSDRSLVIYHNNLEEEFEIQLALNIISSLIDKAIVKREYRL